jgi:hypothetical protein
MKESQGCVNQATATEKQALCEFGETLVPSSQSPRRSPSARLDGRLLREMVASLCSF